MVHVKKGTALALCPLNTAHTIHILLGSWSFREMTIASSLKIVIRTRKVLQNYDSNQEVYTYVQRQRSQKAKSH